MPIGSGRIPTLRFKRRSPTKTSAANARPTESVNKTAKQWGAFKYDAAQDLGRVPMTVASAAKPVEQFTIEMVPAGKQLTLKLSWDKTVATAAIAQP